MTSMVIPFCDDAFRDRLLAADPRWRQLIDQAPEFLFLGNEEDCDAFVPSHPWQYTYGTDHESTVRDIARQLLADGKRTIIFCHSDLPPPVIIEGAIVFRCSGYASNRPSNEFAQPGFCADPLADRGGELVLREKRSRPSVGFCGWVPHLTSPALRLRSSARRALHRLGYGRDAQRSPRARAILALTRYAQVDTDFTIRRRTTWTASAAKRAALRGEFVDNLIGNDYALCVRGVGNYSYRLYEALASGRIPVFVNTDCMMPCEGEIDWREVCVWVEDCELDKIGERVLEFHEGISDAEFRDRQRWCRELWLRYLSAAAFHRWIVTELLPPMLTPNLSQPVHSSGV